MAVQTEAACLLETGALYEKRLMLRPLTGDPIFAGFKQGAFSLYFGDAPIFHLDLEGRWQRAFVDGLHYLKSLDGSVQTIDRVREGKNLVLKRRSLTDDEVRAFDERVRTTALSVMDTLEAGDAARVEPPSSADPLSDEQLRGFLERIAAWDSAAWTAHRARYAGTYGPLPFLPPDCTSPVILQATLGHVGGRAFGLAPGDAHRVRSVAEFETHAREVHQLLGRRLAQCKVVFLAGSDALRRSEGEIAANLAAIRDVFPIEMGAFRKRVQGGPLDEIRLEGIDSLLDEFAPPRPDRAAWTRFAALGLRRVSLGVESGSARVRSLYGKSWSDDDLRSLVSDLKAAGLHVSPMLLVGAGGIENAVEHVAESMALLNALELGAGDIVWLLDANEVAGAHWDELSREAGFTALTGSAWSEQQATLRQGLAPVRTEKGAKVAPYSLEKQGQS